MLKMFSPLTVLNVTLLAIRLILFMQHTAALNGQRSTVAYFQSVTVNSNIIKVGLLGTG